jgi:hypothetical protein
MKIPSYPLYIGSFDLSRIEKQVLIAIAACAVRSKPWRGGYGKLGELIGTDPFTVGRAVRSLERRGHVDVVRRGARKPNAVMLGWALWRRMIGPDRNVWSRWRTGRVDRLSPDEALAAVRRARESIR